MCTLTCTLKVPLKVKVQQVTVPALRSLRVIYARHPFRHPFRLSA